MLVTYRAWSQKDDPDAAKTTNTENERGMIEFYRTASSEPVIVDDGHIATVDDFVTDNNLLGMKIAKASDIEAKVTQYRASFRVAEELLRFAEAELVSAKSKAKTAAEFVEETNKTMDYIRWRFNVMSACGDGVSLYSGTDVSKFDGVAIPSGLPAQIGKYELVAEKIVFDNQCRATVFYLEREEEFDECTKRIEAVEEKIQEAGLPVWAAAEKKNIAATKKTDFTPQPYDWFSFDEKDSVSTQVGQGMAKLSEAKSVVTGVQFVGDNLLKRLAATKKWIDGRYIIKKEMTAFLKAKEDARKKKEEEKEERKEKEEKKRKEKEEEEERKRKEEEDEKRKEEEEEEKTKQAKRKFEEEDLSSTYADVQKYQEGSRSVRYELENYDYFQILFFVLKLRTMSGDAREKEIKDRLQKCEEMTVQIGTTVDGDDASAGDSAWKLLQEIKPGENMVKNAFKDAETKALARKKLLISQFINVLKDIQKKTDPPIIFGPETITSVLSGLEVDIPNLDIDTSLCLLVVKSMLKGAELDILNLNKLEKPADTCKQIKEYSALCSRVQEIIDDKLHSFFNFLIEFVTKADKSNQYAIETIEKKLNDIYKVYRKFNETRTKLKVLEEDIIIGVFRTIATDETEFTKYLDRWKYIQFEKDQYGNFWQAVEAYKEKAREIYSLEILELTTLDLLEATRDFLRLSLTQLNYSTTIQLQRIFTIESNQAYLLVTGIVLSTIFQQKAKELKDHIGDLLNSIDKLIEEIKSEPAAAPTPGFFDNLATESQLTDLTNEPGKEVFDLDAPVEPRPETPDPFSVMYTQPASTSQLEADFLVADSEKTAETSIPGSSEYLVPFFTVDEPTPAVLVESEEYSQDKDPEPAAESIPEYEPEEQPITIITDTLEPEPEYEPEPEPEYEDGPEPDLIPQPTTTDPFQRSTTSQDKLPKKKEEEEEDQFTKPVRTLRRPNETQLESPKPEDVFLFY